MTYSEPTLIALDRASEALREANHAGFNAPATPESLYNRCAIAAEMLGRMQQVLSTLSRQTEAVANDGEFPGPTLASDDEVPASQHVDEARATLWLAADGLENAMRLASRAQNSLSHLKYEDV